MVTPVSVMALALVGAHRLKQDIRIEDVSALFVPLRAQGLGGADVALRRVPRGVYSEDVEAFVGGLLAGNYATARSPITLYDNGVRICCEIVQKAYARDPTTFGSIAKALNLDIALQETVTHPAAV